MPSIYLNKNRNKYLSEELSILSDCANPTLRWILSGFDDFEKRIDEIKKSWSPKVREFYRDVLNLKTKKNPIKTIYRLDNNGKFIRLIEENFPDLNFSELISLQQFLHELNHVKPYYTSDNARKSLLYAENYALAKLKKYNLEEIIKTLFNLHKRTPEDDVFGSYFYKQHTVEIYVIPCIIFSMIIKEDFQDMLIGTLAHELAHAFHHIGEDKDGYTWETMPNIELSLVEGLAEYYAREFSKNVSGLRSSVLTTFDKTSKYLPEEYTKYKQWGENFDLEAIYQAFIETRRIDVRSFDEFNEILENATVRLDPP